MTTLSPRLFIETDLENSSTRLDDIPTFLSEKRVTPYSFFLFIKQIILIKIIMKVFVAIMNCVANLTQKYCRL